MIKLYNTLTRKKEEFVPLVEGKVSMYSCGPTVYKYAHFGNMRAYIFMDSLRRVLEYNGYKVKSVMNITDVGHLLSDADEGEDKMVQSAAKENKTVYEIADFYTEQFFKDTDALNILRPTVAPKATDNIPEMIEMVKTLLEKGYAYETEDGIYFSVEKFPNYGKLSGVNLEEQMHGARVEVNTTKRNPIDFALWKKAEPNHIMQWDSPWGKGYPGWHIECSVMSAKYLGKVFDIHTGGIDHIPIHHENEIAQSESCFGTKTTNYWMHNGFMSFEGGKMSKSLGNAFTITELNEKGYSPMVCRYFCLNVQYRQGLNFTFEAMDGAKTAYERLGTLLLRHKQSEVKTDEEILDKYKGEFLSAINDDLNIPLAIGVLWTMLKEKPSKDIYELAIDFDRVFGLRLDKITPPEKKTEPIPEQIQQILTKREQARKDKNWALSDELRAEADRLGYSIKDTKDGQVVEKK
jgi:cysteinyl-tRNA synthetase